jgi:hypothetical protein
VSYGGRDRRAPSDVLHARLCDRCRVATSGIGAPALEDAAVYLYWLPLGAGGYFVRLNGRMFEAVAARAGRRPPSDLYHSALEVRIAAARFVIEQTPVRDNHGEQRGVVAEGAVGTRWGGRFRLFRYEIRRWRDGRIPDIDEAVGGPRRLTDDRARTQRVLDLVPQVPTPVWGRDDLKAGEMWNSNSVIAWLIASSGLETDSIQPPASGRAPGWQAGLTVAKRQDGETRDPAGQPDSSAKGARPERP